jgi:hypothetical protein
VRDAAPLALDVAMIVSLRGFSLDSPRRTALESLSVTVALPALAKLWDAVANVTVLAFLGTLSLSLEAVARATWAVSAHSPGPASAHVARRAPALFRAPSG